MVAPTTGQAFHDKGKDGWMKRGMIWMEMPGRPVTREGLQKTVPERRAADSGRQERERSN